MLDERGQFIWGDKLMILLSRTVPKEHLGATNSGDVKCSQTLFDDIAAHGGKSIMSAVGHNLIKAKINETDAHLAGEMSGHISSTTATSVLMTSSTPPAASLKACKQRPRVPLLVSCSQTCRNLRHVRTARGV